MNIKILKGMSSYFLSTLPKKEATRARVASFR